MGEETGSLCGSDGPDPGPACPCRVSEKTAEKERDSSRGAGVCASQRDCLFEPLTASKPDTLGIDLALSRTIVVAHGGALWAEPLEAGTTYCFALPRSKR